MINKKVAIITYYFNIRDTDRPYSVYKYFKQKGFNVEVICGDYDHNAKQYKEYDIDDINSIHVKKYSKNISIKRIYSNLMFAIDASKYIKNTKHDIYYIIIPPNITAFLCGIIAKKSNSKLIVDVFDLYPETIPLSPKIKKILNLFGLWIWSYLRDYSIKISDVFISSCNYYLSYLGISKSKKNHVVPLCKGNARINNVKFIDNDCLNIVYLGALTHNYDFESLIYIMKELKNVNKRAKLSIIGDGENREWLLMSLKKNEIEFEFYGRMYDDVEKEKILTKCHFGFNGFKENTNIALSYKSMEYMSNGLALINSCKEDTWNLVNSNNIGINYNNFTLDKLINQMINLTADEIQEMKENSLQVYNKYYSFDKYLENMDSIIDHF